MLPDLDYLLAYQNPDVIERYKNDYPSNELGPEDALKELLKYFWLNEKLKSDKTHAPTNENLFFDCAIHSEMREIDTMWHTFLLFTKDYAAFCQRYFGKFIHHQPVQKESITSRKKQELELRRFLSYVYDNLGEETLVLWFKPLLG